MAYRCWRVSNVYPLVRSHLLLQSHLRLSQFGAQPFPASTARLSKKPTSSELPAPTGPEYEPIGELTYQMLQSAADTCPSWSSEEFGRIPVHDKVTLTGCLAQIIYCRACLLELCYVVVTDIHQPLKVASFAAVLPGPQGRFLVSECQQLLPNWTCNILLYKSVSARWFRGIKAVYTGCR